MTFDPFVFGTHEFMDPGGQLLAVFTGNRFHDRQNINIGLHMRQAENPPDVRKKRSVPEPGQRIGVRVPAAEKRQQRLNAAPGLDRRLERRRLERQQPCSPSVLVPSG